MKNCKYYAGNNYCNFHKSKVASAYCEELCDDHDETVENSTSVENVSKEGVRMLEKEIVYFRQPAKIACDGKCDKAWGINRRPKVQLDENNVDDYAYLSDEELGTAPEDPGTYENGYAKPLDDDEKLNRWCCRECERCSMSKPSEFDKPIILKDFSKRIYNIPRS